MTSAENAKEIYKKVVSWAFEKPLVSTLPQAVESATYAEQLEGILKPLRLEYNINGFVHTRFFPFSKTCISIGSHSEWSRYFYKNKLNLYGMLNKNLSIFSGNYTFLDNVPKDSVIYQKVYKHAEEKFDLCHGVLMVQLGINYIDAFVFYVPKSEWHFNAVFLENINEFKRFIRIYKSEKRELINDVIKHLRHPFYLKDTRLEILDFNPTYKKAIPVNCKNYYLEEAKITLSSREIEVLWMTCNGNTAKETAIKLGLSYRTVEHYLAVIRQKFACRSKPELLAKIKKENMLEVLEDLFC